MNEASITEYITRTFEGVHPVDAWGDSFFFYNPDDKLPDEFYFATLATQDHEGDSASNLNRPSVFRLNVGIGKATFRSLFGTLPSRRGGGEAVDPGYDYAALDQLMPHPVYGRMYWVCVLNPSDDTFHEVVRPLLAEAYELAVGKYAKRAARGESQ